MHAAAIQPTTVLNTPAGRSAPGAPADNAFEAVLAALTPLIPAGHGDAPSSTAEASVASHVNPEAVTEEGGEVDDTSALPICLPFTLPMTSQHEQSAKAALPSDMLVNNDTSLPHSDKRPAAAAATAISAGGEVSQPFLAIAKHARASVDQATSAEADPEAGVFRGSQQPTALPEEAGSRATAAATMHEAAIDLRPGPAPGESPAGMSGSVQPVRTVPREHTRVSVPLGPEGNAGPIVAAANEGKVAPPSVPIMKAIANDGVQKVAADVPAAPRAYSPGDASMISSGSEGSRAAEPVALAMHEAATHSGSGESATCSFPATASSSQTGKMSELPAPWPAPEPAHAYGPQPLRAAWSQPDASGRRVEVGTTCDLSLHRNLAFASDVAPSPRQPGPPSDTKGAVTGELGAQVFIEASTGQPVVVAASPLALQPVQPSTYSTVLGGHMSSTQPAHAPLVQIADVIVAQRAGSTEIVLNPHELGRVKVTISGDSADLHVALVVERPETLDLVRRHAEILVRELRQSGVEQTRLDFMAQGDAQAGARGDQQGGRQSGGQPLPLADHRERGGRDVQDPSVPASPAASAASLARAGSTRIDIRI